MASNGQGEGRSDGSSSERGRRNGRKDKEPKVRQRGLGIAELELLRLRSQMAAAAPAGNVAGGSVVSNNLQDVPVYSFTSPNQLHDGLRVQNPYYLSPVRPFFSYAPITAPPPAGPQGITGGLSCFPMGGGSSSPSFWHTDPALSSTTYQLHCPQSTKVSMGSEGCDLQLGSSTSRPNEEATKDEDDIEFGQPNYFTNLLLAEDSEEQEEPMNKKARTDSSGAESLAAAGSRSSEEPDLELRLSF